ncbi:MAG: DNA translocase FtsK, partial [Longimicrobiales bacterium]
MAGKTSKGSRSRSKASSSKKKKTTSKKRRSSKKSAPQEGRQREVLAVLLAVLAFFVAVALIPVDGLGAGVAEFFPSGNPMGVMGGTVKTLLVSLLGLGSIAVPFALGTMAAWIGEWINPQRLRKAWALTLGVLVLLPFGAWIASGPPESFGSFGAAMAEPTVAVFGWLGGWLLLFTGVVLTCVFAFDFNPLRTVGSGAMTVAQGVGRSSRAASAQAQGWLEERREKREYAKAMARQAAAARPKREPYDGQVPTPAETAEMMDEVLGPAPVDVVEPLEEAEVEPWESVPPDEPKYQPPAPFVPEVDLLPEDELPAYPHPLPTLDLLTAAERESRAGMVRELDRLGEVLVEKLRTFNVNCELGGRTTGPVVTQYEVVPAPGVKVNRIANLDADLALAMKARSIRIVAPIPGKGAVGVEIPNPEPEVVRLRTILDAPAFARARGVLPLGLGKDLTGHPFVSDLAKMPHALIAGATGSGKSVCLNTIITSLVYKHGPANLRLLLIDPKMVELSAYSDLPHLRHPVVTDPRDAAGVLKWAVMEMERRYALLSENGVRSLAEFNERVANDVVLKRPVPDGPEGDEDRWIYKDGPLPFIVVVVDELADLMMTVAAEVEKPLTQLAQKARAIGIHLIVATQRPSVNVITGLIKANFPCRIAFRVASKTDSRTILDQNGADSLLGHGDML